MASEPSEQVLSSSPRMLPLFAKAGAAMIPGAAKLPLLRGGARGQDVPDTVLSLNEVSVERARLANYDRVCSFPLRDQLPCTFVHVLAFPLHLRLMTDPAFPFPALGLVHIENQITQIRPVLASESLDLRVWATPLEPHARGRKFDLRSEARVGDELVWEEISTILKRGPSGEGSERRLTDGSKPSEELPVTATWRLSGDLGRRYGSVSGDLNPIHIHPVSAKLLGFPSAIAHGMWTTARCLAALGPRLPDRFTVHAAFRKPILLPATVQFSERADAKGALFAVRGAGKGTPHLDGRVTF